MRWLDGLFTRRRIQPHADRLAWRTRRWLRHACRELSESERQVVRALALEEAPGMVLVDEEAGVIVPPDMRRIIEGEEAPRRRATD
ncbi:hypothetical protein [Pedomonas mirosovicensis]|uniref:hypothetical protein n=1 Tax=Pedomonas mirosovicensis TaxID=2908641 RepID=UPI0021674AAE|nr:hypothetical protein [Pedomonas mirosovicensis]MCH8683843.1 hypothetical protein [Pedomonas mirosovicensis]